MNTIASCPICYFSKDIIVLQCNNWPPTSNYGDPQWSSLWELPFDLSSWKMLPPLPCFAPGLAIYCSQLVLVGGKLSRSRSPTNKLWVSDDDGLTWQQSLPPMPTPRVGPAVVNTGTPEYLIVAGGDHVLKQNHWNLYRCPAVEVLVEEVWVTVTSLPSFNGEWGFSCSIKHTLHGGSLYLSINGPGGVFISDIRSGCIAYCGVKTLISEVRGAASDNLWSILNFDDDLKIDTLQMFSFQNQLLCVINQYREGPSLCLRYNQSLVRIGNCIDHEVEKPCIYENGFYGVLPGGNLSMVCVDLDGVNFHTASIKGSSN